jgi:hypothetical protein
MEWEADHPPVLIEIPLVPAMPLFVPTPSGTIPPDRPAVRRFSSTGDYRLMSGITFWDMAEEE